MATEIFTNNATTTVSVGGTTAPTSGTTESWTVASSASFPAASNVAGTTFHVADVALPSEIILVTNVSGTTWSVTRGAEGTTPVAHTTGFIIQQVVTAGFLNTSAQQAVDWINAVATYGADSSGATDASSAINSAITAANAQANGGIVYLPTGTYKLNSPVQLLAGVTLVGDHPYGQDWYASFGSVLKPSSSFSAGSAPVSGAIIIYGNATGSTNVNNCGIRNMTILGSTSPASVDGIAAWGNVNALVIENVGIDQTTGRGIAGYNNSGNSADAWTVNNVGIKAPTGDGFTLYGNDHSLNNVHVQSGSGNGFFLQCGNTRLTACRAEVGALDGYVYGSLVGGGQWTGISFVNCNSQGNAHNGWRITNTSGGGQQLPNTVQLVGCRAEGDGVNGGSGGGGYGAFRIEGGAYVTINNCNVVVKTNSVATGCPQWSLVTASIGTAPGVPNLVQAMGGFWSCVPGTGAVLWHDTAPANTLSIDVHGYFGTSGSPQPANTYTPTIYSVNPL